VLRASINLGNAVLAAGTPRGPTGVTVDLAYDLFLTRSLATAEVVRGDEGVGTFAREGLDVGAGIRQSVTGWTEAHPGHRVLDPAFMQIRQAVATRRNHDAATIDFLHDVVEELKASGDVAASLVRSGRGDVPVAPLA
jgi:polar amino acid transport system substrate-binding protein